jgi:hypothetical protein
MNDGTWIYVYAKANKYDNTLSAATAKGERMVVSHLASALEANFLPGGMPRAFSSR